MDSTSSSQAVVVPMEKPPGWNGLFIIITNVTISIIFIIIISIDIIITIIIIIIITNIIIIIIFIIFSKYNKVP